jgi:8-oxo-dGTP diphosphatase
MITDKGYLVPDGYTATTVLFARDGRDIYFLAGTRKDDPFKSSLALPGGFVGIEDRGHARLAAVRELYEETGIELDHLILRSVVVHDAIDRDPRGWIIDNVFMVFISKMVTLIAGDDLLNPQWYKMCGKHSLAFDHNTSLREAYELLMVR